MKATEWKWSGQEWRNWNGDLIAVPFSHPLPQFYLHTVADVGKQHRYIFSNCHGSNNLPRIENCDLFFPFRCQLALGHAITMRWTAQKQNLLGVQKGHASETLTKTSSGSRAIRNAWALGKHKIQLTFLTASFFFPLSSWCSSSFNSWISPRFVVWKYFASDIFIQV